jgi:hypothetical protein
MFSSRLVPFTAGRGLSGMAAPNNFAGSKGFNNERADDNRAPLADS